MCGVCMCVCVMECDLRRVCDVSTYDYNMPFCGYMGEERNKGKEDGNEAYGSGCHVNP